MSRFWYYFVFILWISYLLGSSLLLFINGFFLTRVARTERSNCNTCSDCHPTTALKNIQSTEEFCLPPKSRVVLLIVDALKYEFVDWHDGILPNTTFHRNKIPVVKNLLTSKPQSTRLYKFIADPPTTTMQRIKAVTTGTLPTFMDAGSNFASESINEDNLVEQASKKGGAVFMGDDTWISLFPGKFLRQYPAPSFDVWDLDTVDRLVEEKIAKEIGKTDWNLLIAHVLGVDHCGHKHGPYHPEMARKLEETNSLIKKLVNSLDNDTTLFVVGDHGMTDSGDHGGDSKNEVEAAMFVYSKNTFYRESNGIKTTSVNQIDLVPTISTILGLPIPYSNIGALILECLPFGNAQNKDEEKTFAAHSLWRNILQIKKYIDAYTRDTFLFSEENLERLNGMFSRVENNVKNISEERKFEEFFESSKSYIKTVREMCSEVWIQFDPGLMSKGLIIFFSVIFFLYIILSSADETSPTELVRSNFLFIAIVANLVTSSIVYFLYFFNVIDEFKHTNFFSNGIVSIVLLAILVIQNWDSISSVWYSRERLKEIDYYERAIFLMTFCGLFSNSFIVEEDKVMSFLLISSLSILTFKIISENKPYEGRKNSKILSARNFFSLIVFGFVVCTAIRTSNYFWRCREEQNQEDCLMSTGKATFSRFKIIEKIQLTLSVISLAIYVSVASQWLRASERLSGLWRTLNIARYFYSVIAITIGCYWVFEKLPKDARVKNVILKQIEALPGIVYFFAFLGIIIVFSKPLGFTSFSPLNQFRETGEIQPRNFFEKILFYLYSKFSLNTGLIVYGSSTLYSSAFISISVFATLLWTLVLGNVFAIGVFVMIFTCIAVLGISAIERFNSSNNLLQLFQVSNSALLCWFLISEYFFYATGHQSTFPTIHWNAAFIGTSGNSYGNFLPSILIGLNTFGSHFIAALNVPLLLIAPFTIYVMIPAIAKPTVSTESELRKGELCLIEYQPIFHNSLFVTYGKYILLHGIRTFVCMLTTTIHCRHLMAWKIFAPKLIFQGLSFFVTLGSVLFSALIVRNINYQVNKMALQAVVKAS